MIQSRGREKKREVNVIVRINLIFRCSLMSGGRACETFAILHACVVGDCGCCFIIAA